MTSVLFGWGDSWPGIALPTRSDGHGQVARYAAAGAVCLRFLRTCTAAIAGIEHALEAAGGKVEGRTAQISKDELSSGQLSNLARYVKKLPAAAEDTTITALTDGVVQFETRVPGRVPGSYALYAKTVDPEGNTIAYTKTTVLPDGSIAHIKDKFLP
jgi:hypothetical protein